MIETEFIMYLNNEGGREGGREGGGREGGREGIDRLFNANSSLYVHVKQKKLHVHVP